MRAARSGKVSRVGPVAVKSGSTRVNIAGKFARVRLDSLSGFCLAGRESPRPPVHGVEPALEGVAKSGKARCRVGEKNKDSRGLASSPSFCQVGYFHRKSGGSRPGRRFRRSLYA